MKKALLLSLMIITPAFAEAVPVKDRCADKDALVKVFELLERNYPPRYADKPSFVFDVNSILTDSYDENLDRVTCIARFTLYPTLVDGKKAGAWVLAVTRVNITEIPKVLKYQQQFVSGSDKYFNVRLQDIQPDPDKEIK